MSGNTKIPSNKTWAFLAITATMTFWGFSYISTKYLLTFFSPFQLSATRYALAVIIMLVIGIVTGRLRPIPVKDWLFLGLAAFTGIFLYFIFENSGLRLTTAGIGSLIIATIPVLNVIVNALFLKKQSSMIVWFGVVLSIIGVFLVIKGGSDFSFKSLIGNLLVIGAAFCWVAYTMFNQPLSQKYDAFSLNTYQAIIGAVLLIILAWFEGNRFPEFTLPIILNLSFLVICCSALGYIFYIYALGRLGSTIVTTFVNFIPVFGVIGGVLILGEPFGLLQLFGGLIIVAGITLVSREDKILKILNKNHNLSNIT